MLGLAWLVKSSPDYVLRSILLESIVSLIPISNPVFRRLKAYESHLATVAFSNVESSRTVSQILAEVCEVATAAAAAASGVASSAGDTMTSSSAVQQQR